MFNKRKFKARIYELGLSYEKIANILGINVATLYRKINGISDFNRAEIQILRNVLRLSASEADSIFFTDELT